MVTIRKNIQELENMFDVLNAHFFNNILEKPVICLNPNTSNNRLSYGWCTINRIWKDLSKKNSYYEITICPEFLNRSVEEIAATLLHEMTHLYNQMFNIKDCSRGNTYHNKRFKTEAEKHGLTIGFNKKYGWTLTSLNDDGKRFIKNSDIQISPFVRGNLYILVDQNNNIGNNPSDKSINNFKKKKNHSIKYQCPKCKNSVRATKQIRIKCVDCDCIMDEVR